MQKELTKAEMDVMMVVWRRGTTTVHGILESMADPKPAYNTVATVLRVLERKGFVGRKTVGRVHEFEPKVLREAYAAQVMDGVLGNFFGGSVVQMVSFFAEKENISANEFDQILAILKGAKNECKNDEKREYEKPKKARLWIK